MVEKAIQLAECAFLRKNELSVIVGQIYEKLNGEFTACFVSTHSRA